MNYETISQGISDARLALANVGSQVGMSGLQVQNAILSGDASIVAKLQECCCENRLLTTQQGYENRIQTIDQTNQLNNTINANGQKQVDAIADLKTTMISEFCAARERDMQAIIDKQADEINQLRTKDNINSQTAQILTVVGQRLDPIVAAVKEIQDKMPNTVAVTWPNLSVVNNTPQNGGYYYPGYQGGF